MNNRNHHSVLPEDLLAYSTGEADLDIAAHIADCVECAASAATYARLDRTLQARLFRSACPGAHRLGELALNLLRPEETLATRMHLAECPHCTAELSTLSAQLREDPLASLLPRLNPLARLVARLLPTPGLHAGLAGVRGNAAGPSLTFQVGSLTLSFSVEPAGDGTSRRWMLLGLVVDPSGGAALANATVRLVDHETVITEAALDALGMLAIMDLAPGTYDLEITLSDQVVVVPDIAVGAD